MIKNEKVKFDDIYLDGDGKVTQEEFTKFRTQRRSN